MVNKMSEKENVWSQVKKFMFTLAPFGQVMHLYLSEYCFSHLDFTNDTSNHSTSRHDHAKDVDLTTNACLFH